MSDHKLIAAIKDGSQEGLKHLFDRYYADLVRYGAIITDRADVAEEIVQDIFIWLWEKREDLMITSNVKSYLMRAVKNRCINFLKSSYYRSIQSETTEQPGLSQTLQPVDDLQLGELMKLLSKAESLLPERTAAVFSMSRHLGLSNREIARELDISIKTVEYHISNALKEIRRFLAGQGYTYPSILIFFYFF